MSKFLRRPDQTLLQTLYCWSFAKRDSPAQMFIDNSVLFTGLEFNCTVRDFLCPWHCFFTDYNVIWNYKTKVCIMEQNFEILRLKSVRCSAHLPNCKTDILSKDLAQNTLLLWLPFFWTMKFEKFIGITFCSWSKQVKLQEMSHFCGGYCLSTLFRVCSMRASWKETLMLWTTHKLVTVAEPLYMYYYMKGILKCQGTPTIFLSNYILKNLK